MLKGSFNGQPWARGAREAVRRAARHLLHAQHELEWAMRTTERGCGGSGPETPEGAMLTILRILMSDVTLLRNRAAFVACQNWPLIAQAIYGEDADEAFEETFFDPEAPGYYGRTQADDWDSWAEWGETEFDDCRRTADVAHKEETRCRHDIELNEWGGVPWEALIRGPGAGPPNGPADPQPPAG